MPITLRPGMVATRADSADMLRAMSSASWITRLALMPARGLELVHRHHRAGADFDDVAADVEILEHAFEQAGVALQPGAVDRDVAPSRRRRVEQARAAGSDIIVAEREARLAARRPCPCARPCAARRRRSAWRVRRPRPPGASAAGRRRRPRPRGGAARAARRLGGDRVGIAAQARRRPVAFLGTQAEREIAEREPGDGEQGHQRQAQRPFDRRDCRSCATQRIDPVRRRRGRSRRPSRREGPTPRCPRSSAAAMPSSSTPASATSRARPIRPRLGAAQQAQCRRAAARAGTAPRPGRTASAAGRWHRRRRRRASWSAGRRRRSSGSDRRSSG